eukprot:3639293-Rhodomonas_salina.1
MKRHRARRPRMKKRLVHRPRTKRCHFPGHATSAICVVGNRRCQACADAMACADTARPVGCREVR